MAVILPLIPLPSNLKQASTKGQHLCYGFLLCWISVERIIIVFALAIRTPKLITKINYVPLCEPFINQIFYWMENNPKLVQNY